MYMGFKENAARDLIVNITKCDDDCMIEKSKDCTIEKSTNSSETEVEIDVAPVDVFYGNNAKLSVNYTSDDCGELIIYIPSNIMEPTGQTEFLYYLFNYAWSLAENKTISSSTATIVKNLTSTFCNFYPDTVEHRICVHTNETKCYEIEPEAPVFVNTTNEPPSLEARRIESGTEVSLFCKKDDIDCVGLNYALAFNYKICKFLFNSCITALL